MSEGVGVVRLQADAQPRRRLRVGVQAASSKRRRLSHLLAREGLEVAPSVAAHESLDVVVCRAGDGRAEDALARAERVTGAPVVLVAPVATRQRVADALDAGIRGFVVEEDVETRLAPTIEAVASGQVVIPAEHREVVARPSLTAREKQVLSLVVLGLTNAEIAARLYVTKTTIKSHLSSAYRKLGVRSRREATEVILGSPDGPGFGVLSLSPFGTVAALPAPQSR